MAKRTQGAKIPWGEIEKGAAKAATTLGGLIGKVIKDASKGKTTKKIRTIGSKNNMGYINVPKKAPVKKAPAKKAPAKKAPAKKAAVSPTGRPIGRIAATKPERRARDYYEKGATLPKTGSAQRASERSANRYLKRAGEPMPPKQRVSDARKSDVKGSIITPPSKPRLQNRAKPPTSAYEADTLRAQKKADAASIGRGQPRNPKKKPKPEPKKQPPKKVPEVAPPKKSPVEVMRELKVKADNAKTSAEKQMYQARLRQYIIKNKKG